MNTNKYIQRELRYACKLTVEGFTKLCEIERTICNNCETCPFRWVQESIDIEILDNTDDKIVTSLTYPTFSGIYYTVR